MLALAAAVVALFPVADGAYRGDRVALTVRDRRVVAVRTTVRRYVCDPFGDVGPLRIRLATDARIGRSGRVRLTAGPPSERLRLTARFTRRGGATGHIRVRGTIGTGDPCASPRRRFVVD